jgi:hypothetical protein
LKQLKGPGILTEKRNNKVKQQKQAEEINLKTNNFKW